MEKFNLEKIKSYRKKHKRCRYCIYFVYDESYYYRCAVKHVYLPSSLKYQDNIRGCLCSYYEPSYKDLEFKEE